MNRIKYLGMALAAIFALLPASTARADEETDIPCGWAWEKTNSGKQIGTGAWLAFIVETRLTGLPCQIGAFAEGSVAGVGGSAVSGDGVLTGTAARQVPVPYYAKWTVNGSHSRGSIFGPFHLGVSVSEAEIVAGGNEPPPETEPEPDQPQELPDTCSEENQMDCPSPIIFGRDGEINTTSAANGVKFDIDADGVLDQVAWTSDPLLAMDRNGNGIIDNGSELFGNYTPTEPGMETAKNGFEALKFLEAECYGPSERNGVIDSRDAAFRRLLLWTDTNHNGISEKDELVPAYLAGLVSISTKYTEENSYHDKNRNWFRQEGTSEWVASKKLSQTFIVPTWDVWFQKQ